MILMHLGHLQIDPLVKIHMVYIVTEMVNGAQWSTGWKGVVTRSGLWVWSLKLYLNFLNSDCNGELN